MEVLQSGESAAFVRGLAPVKGTLSNGLPLAKLRQAAFQSFEVLGVPTPKNEDWKYTSLHSLQRRAFSIASDSGKLSTKSFAEYYLPIDGAIRLVFLNGAFVPTLSELKEIKGLSVQSLKAAVNNSTSHAVIEAHLGKLLPHEEHSFSALNTALWQDGAFIRIAADASITQPIQLLFVATEDQTETIHSNRNLIIAEENAQAQVVETYVGYGDASYLRLAATEIFCAKGSVVDHTKVQHEASEAFHLAQLGVKQESQSRFGSHVFSFGGKLVRNEITPLLNGENIECLMNGLTVSRGEQHVDNTTVIDHAKPNCFSRELYKGIYNDKSSGVFSGTIIVREDAQKTNAIQSNKTLLLSNDASIDTRPQLKIYADDVKCTHGATIGQLDEDAMFYLQSRGIDKVTAKNMLIHAFASDIIRYVPLDLLRHQLESWLMARLA